LQLLNYKTRAINRQNVTGASEKTAKIIAKMWQKWQM
jgi:hypothetical protein